MKNKQLVISIDVIRERIYLVRGIKVMLSHDLATLYEVAPKVLLQAVKRNLERFPEDFMFQLNGARSSTSNVTNCDLRKWAWSILKIPTLRVYRAGSRYVVGCAEE